MEVIVSIGPETHMELQALVDELFCEEWNIRERICMPRICMHLDLGASDASGKAGAGVGWRSRGIPHVIHFSTWSTQEKGEDINMRETRASLSKANAITRW